MVDFSPQDVVIGGAHGYAEHINSSGTHVQHIELRDDPGTGNLMKVWGACFTPQGDAFFALGQIATYEDYTPHDICYIPGTVSPREFAVLIPRLDDTLELWRYDEDGNVLDTFTGLDTDTGWTHETPCKLCVACDGTTVFYTDQGETIFSFDLTSGTQNADFDTAPTNYIYAGIDIDGLNDLYVNLTPIVSGGVGPRRDLSLGGLDHLWVDQVNETPIKVYKRSTSDGSEILNHEVSLDPSDINSEVLSLAVYYHPCGGFTRVVRVNFIS